LSSRAKRGICFLLIATRAAAAQQAIPIVGTTAPSAKSTSKLGGILGVRELSDGRVLVNDAGRRQIVIFDAALTSSTVAQDSTPGTSNSYGSRAAEIVRYLGDSTLFTENASREVAILDRNGRVVRALSLPPYQENGFVADGLAPFPMPFPSPRAMDDRGRLLGLSGTNVRRGKLADSTIVVRADLASRQSDAVGAIYHAQGVYNRQDPPQDGKRVVTSVMQPVETTDAWAVLSDGTIAFVRGRDYHVDWILPDGTKGATAKLPFDWKRLSDAEKQHLVDSARVVADSLMRIRNARANTTVSDPSPNDPSGRGRGGGGGAAPGQQGSIQRVEFVPLSQIPDYYPPINENAASADLDGNLWILPTTSAQSQHGELVYDVVNPKQGLFRRVRMPVGRSVAGFGKDGVVYLQSGSRAEGFYLERVKLEISK
jgi:hypothetical protein